MDNQSQDSKRDIFKVVPLDNISNRSKVVPMKLEMSNGPNTIRTNDNYCTETVGSNNPDNVLLSGVMSSGQDKSQYSGPR